MKNGRTKNARRNILWGTLNKVITLLIPFITRTVMIYVMGMDYVGLGSLFSSILQVLSFADLGIGGAIVFSMYKPIAENDYKKVSALLNFYRSAYRIIGLIILGIGLLLMPFLDYLVAGDVPKDINLQLLFIIFLLNNILGYFLFAYKQSVFTASQRVDVISKIGMVLQIVLNVAQIVLLLIFRNYYIYILVVPIVTILNNTIVGIVANRLYPEYNPHGKIEKDEINSIWKKIGGMLFQKIGNIILSSVDTIVISSFLGLKVLGIFHGYTLIITSLFGFLVVIQQSIIPAIGNSAISESKEKNLEDFKKFHFLYMWIVIWWCCCLLCLFQPFIKLWQGADNMLSNDCVILFVIYFFSYKMGDVNWMYREALGLWWEARFIPLTSSIINLTVNLILVNIIGLPGILISTIVSLTFVNLPWSSKVVFTKYFESKKEYKQYLFKTFIYFISMIICAAVTFGLCYLVHGSPLLSLFIKFIICMIVPNIIMLAINYKNRDFKLASKFVLKLIPKKFIPKSKRGY